MRFKWIDDHRDHWEPARLCRVLCVSRSGYYAWRKRRDQPGVRAKRRAQLIEQIRAAHEESRGLYGSPRIHAVLAEKEIAVCVNTVAILMKNAHIRSKITRRFRVKTTDSHHDYQPAENLLDRQFNAMAPNRKWLCDITYVPTEEGTLYLASVLDVFSRRIVGWSMATHLRSELCLDALKMALSRRQPAEELLHHSDRGTQYACDAYQQLREQHGISCSMSRSGNCYDNAMMESFHGTLKNELVYQQPGCRFSSIQESRHMVFEFIEVFYNRQRRHSALAYLSPETFEARLN
jgi:putative transposase